jgi:NCAIR mutase (PurE)-related protein
MARLKRIVSGLTYHPEARAATWVASPVTPKGRGTVLVVCAGTSDIPVAEEAVLTASMLGSRVERLFDVGVAGIHRLMDNRHRLEEAAVLIVVAGMEGALPSVVAGLVDKPVIAVPTSIGYGASFNGLAALLAMLNSCAAGVTVVNIDNGFGAAFAACLINQV